MNPIRDEWQSDDGSVRLILGDCLEVLPTLKPGAVVTDPPYGIRHSSSHGASWQDTVIAGDTDTSTRDAALACVNGCPVACFGTWKTPPIVGVRGVLIWDKGPAFGMGDLSFPWKPSWELIYVRGAGWAGTRDEGVLRGHIVVSWESAGRVHPHQKPVSLIEAIYEKLADGLGVCDPFMGSGSAGVAAVRVGRGFVGIEIDRHHWETSVARVRAELERFPLFEQSVASLRQLEFPG